jgi:catechol 2,3-dioxygenase-like lactoylglutathione lyase family enzyme
MPARSTPHPTAPWCRPRWDDLGVKIFHQVVVFDAADLTAESAFWAGVLGGTVDAEDDWHMVLVDGRPRIGVQLAPNHVPPDWPHGTPQQIHLDLWVDDPAAADDLVKSLGATVLKEADDGDSPDTFQVYADPAGHPFCLCWVRSRKP